MWGNLYNPDAYDPSWYEWDGYDTNQQNNDPDLNFTYYDETPDTHGELMIAKAIVAAQIARQINADPTSPHREIGALMYRDTDGRIKARPLSYGYVDPVTGLPKIAFQLPPGVSRDQIVGIVNNHPYYGFANGQERLMSRLPSDTWTDGNGNSWIGEDWNTARNLVNNHGVVANDFSYYIIDSWVVMREYFFTDQDHDTLGLIQNSNLYGVHGDWL